MRKNFYLFLILFSIVLICFNYITNLNSEKAKQSLDLAEVRIRDFMFYTCNSIKRIGGREQLVQNAPDELFRIDGAWFICLDQNLAPRQSECNVLSFGIFTDFLFDEQIRQLYDCNVHSFDPFKEAWLFKNIRKANKELQNSPILKVNEKWHFYRIGISENKSVIENKPIDKLSIGDILNTETILEMTNLKNKIIDVVKMDVEGAEKSFMENLDMEYACRYFKQLLFETHHNFIFKDLVKLEKCFRLFRRDTRFHSSNLHGPTGHLTEFQYPKEWNLNLKMFKNEIDLAEYMFLSGELYFININFL